MITYNTGFHATKVIAGPTQEEIYRMPEYFALSRAEIYADPRCPDFLKFMLDEFPWDGRHNVIQVRPQDFRRGKPALLGDHWHTDIMVRLNDGKARVCKTVDEFHLMVCSWGDVTETEFMATPFQARDIFDGVSPEFKPMELLNLAHQQPQRAVKAKPGQLFEYTSRDLHRMSNEFRPGKLRLMIVAFDCDTVESGGFVLPSIEERERGIGPRFEDYVR